MREFLRLRKQKQIFRILNAYENSNERVYMNIHTKMFVMAKKKVSKTTGIIHITMQMLKLFYKVRDYACSIISILMRA